MFDFNIASEGDGMAMLITKVANECVHKGLWGFVCMEERCELHTELTHGNTACLWPGTSSVFP